MLRVLIPVVCGILFASFFTLPIIFWLVGVVVAGVMMLWARSSLYALLFLFLAGGCVEELTRKGDSLPFDRPLLIRLRVEEEPVKRLNGSRSVALIEAWREGSGAWQGARTKAHLYDLDTTRCLRLGDRLVARSSLKPYRADRGYWSRLYHLRGFSGSLFLGEGSLVEELPPHRDPIRGVHEVAVERIERLPLRPESRAIVLAMTCGERREIDSLQRVAYARSGASHLLAVSGLHVGVVFLLAGLLFGLIPLVRYGHLLRSLLVILCVWGYALMSGSSPSVIRAATMFSIFQFGLLLSGRSAGLNTLCGALCLILLVNPSSLFDISLQLSALAVAAIIRWNPNRFLHVRQPLLRWITASILVSLVATLATAPLLSYRFGIISLIGVPLSPLVIFTAQLIVGISMLWVVLPIGWLAPLFGWVIDTLARIQNSLVVEAADLPMAALDFRLEGWALALLYLLFVLFALAGWCAESKKELSLLSK